MSKQLKAEPANKPATELSGNTRGLKFMQRKAEQALKVRRGAGQITYLH
jgi:hypothetical protein